MAASPGEPSGGGAGRGHHLHDLATLAARLLAGHRDDWLAARPEELDADDVKAILAVGRDLNVTGSVAGERDKAWPTSSTRPAGCATSTTEIWACSLALAWSRRGASGSSGSA